jgi:hypothetical protein
VTIQNGRLARIVADSPEPNHGAPPQVFQSPSQKTTPKRNAAAKRFRDERDLRPERVDRVYDVIGRFAPFPFEERRDRPRVDERPTLFYARRRIDRVNSRLREVCLRLPDRFVRREKLTIDIALLNDVEIDDAKPSNSRARQRLDRVAADRAQSDDHNASGTEPLHPLVAEHQPRALKLIRFFVLSIEVRPFFRHRSYFFLPKILFPFASSTPSL